MVGWQLLESALDPSRFRGDTADVSGKFTANSKEVCWFFNSGQPHRADHLHPDGACKRNHVCDKWVSNKGPGGVCKGTEGTKGHSRAQCDNPHRCDARVDK